MVKCVAFGNSGNSLEFNSAERDVASFIGIPSLVECCWYLLLHVVEFTHVLLGLCEYAGKWTDERD